MSQEKELKLNLFLRFRPLLLIEQNYLPEERNEIIKIDSDKAINIENKQIYYFDKIFNANTPEEEVCSMATSKIINNALNGITSSIISYGGVCTGKTLTMEQIISYTMKEIFKSDILKYNLRISFMEYYLNEWTDILKKKKNLIIYNGTIKDLTLLKINSLNKFNQIYNKGKRNRIDLHKANNNKFSIIFNSHSVLTLNIFKDNNTLLSKIFFIDLMSWAKIDSSCSKGLNFKEISSLNNSLLNLEDAIKSLAKKQIFIPKDKFLKVIKQCFDNNCYISFIMHCANLKMYKNDIKHTLEISEYINRL